MVRGLRDVEGEDGCVGDSEMVRKLEMSHVFSRRLSNMTLSEEEVA